MAAVEPELNLRGDSRVRRRRFVNRLAEGGATLAAFIAVAVLGIVVWSIAKRGAGELSWSFLTRDLPFRSGPTSGGIAPLLVGSADPRRARGPDRAAARGRASRSTWRSSPRLACAAWFSSRSTCSTGCRRSSSASSSSACSSSATTRAARPGSIGLAIMMLPLIARSTQEVLALVPSAQREAALALGASRWRTVLGVILPSALGGILTGTVLAIARAAGETAPLLFVTSIYGRTIGWNPRARAAEQPGADLHLVGVARPGRPPARMGDRARADDVRAPHEPDRAPRARAQPAQAGTMTEEEDVSDRRLRCAPMRPVDVAARDRSRRLRASRPSSTSRA